MDDRSYRIAKRWLIASGVLIAISIIGQIVALAMTAWAG